MSRARLLTGLALAAGCLALGGALASVLGGLELGWTLRDVRYAVEAPAALGLLAVLPLLLWAASGSLTDLPLGQRILSLLLRVTLALVIALALARTSTVHDATRVSAVFMVDVSDSVTDQDLGRAAAVIRDTRASDPDADVRLLTFARRTRQVELPERIEALPELARHAGGGSETDAQAALQMAYGLFPPGHLRRAALLSDGRETRGELLREAQRARRFGVRLFAQPLTEGSPREIAVRELELPRQIEVGESFEVRAHVFSSRAGRAKLRLYQGPVLNGLDSVREVELAQGDNELAFKSIVRTAGEVAYRLTLEPLSDDRFSENNGASATAVVPGRPTVLIVEEKPAHARHLASALNSADFEVEVRPATALPRSLAEITRYDFVILSDVAASRVVGQPMEVIERYVRDVGGGFMMAGGEQSFGLGGYQGTRMESLLPVRMDSERRKDEHSLALALVIDTSGSMSGIKIELAKEAARAAAELLGADDSLAVIGFSGQPERKVRMQSARNRLRIGQNISRLRAQGGTAIFPALDMAFQDLLSTRARIKHVILLTDGQTQEGGIPELVQAMGAERITVSTVGLGGDVNRRLLQEAANLGGGRAYFTSDPHNVPRIFTRETTTVGRSSAVEDLIQPLPAEPADFMKGIDLRRAPYLRGYVATQVKPRPAQVIIRSELGEPLLARWRVGLGWSMAWTSDIKHRWSVDWLRWRELPRFWGQLVREHMRRKRHQELPLGVSLSRGVATVTVDALGPDDRFHNGLESELRIEGPLDSGARTVETRILRQVAPGRYEARVPLERHGTFALSAVHRDGDRVIARSHGQLSHPYSPEYAALAADVRLLDLASTATGGGRLRPGELLDPGDEEISAREPLWPRLLMLALMLFLIDLALRRVRLGSSS